jgi:hypothetical protein
MKGCRYILLFFLLAAAISLSAVAAEQNEKTEPAFSTGALLELSALRMFGLVNTYIPKIPFLPCAVLGIGDFQVQLSYTQLYFRDGWEDGPYYPAFSLAVMLSPRFGWYHPRMGIGMWLATLPRRSPEDDWEIQPGDAPVADADIFQSYCLKVSPLRAGFNIGPLSMDVSLLDFCYGPVIPVTIYPGFRTVGNTVIGVNYGSIGISYTWSKR